MTERQIKKNAYEYMSRCVRMVCKLPFLYRLKTAWKIIIGRE